MWHIGDGWGWWMVMGWLWMAVFWGLIIWAVSALLSRAGDRGRDGDGREASALEILDRRYARGELSDAEFEAMRERVLRTPSTAATVTGTPAGVAR